MNFAILSHQEQDKDIEVKNLKKLKKIVEKHEKEIQKHKKEIQRHKKEIQRHKKEIQKLKKTLEDIQASNQLAEIQEVLALNASLMGDRHQYQAIRSKQLCAIVIKLVCEEYNTSNPEGDHVRHLEDINTDWLEIFFKQNRLPENTLEFLNNRKGKYPVHPNLPLHEEKAKMISVYLSLSVPLQEQFLPLLEFYFSKVGGNLDQLLLCDQEFEVKK